jgi:hypothetical protein
MKTQVINYAYFLLLPIMAIIFSGCASPRPLFLSPAFQHDKIDNIVILPVADIRFNKDKLVVSDKWVRETFGRQLRRKHYRYQSTSDRSFVANITEEDITKADPAWISTLGPSEARWVLLPAIHESSSKLTFGSTGQAEVSAALYDKQNHTMIWRHKVVAKVGQGGLIGMAMKGSMEGQAIAQGFTKVITALPKAR